MRLNKSEPLLGAKTPEEFHGKMEEDLRELLESPMAQRYRLGMRVQGREMAVYQSQVDNTMARFFDPREDRRPQCIIFNGLMRQLVHSQGSPFLKAYMQNYG